MGGGHYFGSERVMGDHERQEEIARMNEARKDRMALLHKIQYLAHVRSAAFANLHPERRTMLVHEPVIAQFAFTHPRFSRRMLQRTARLFHLPELTQASASFAALIACKNETLENLVVHVGFLMILRQLPKVMQRNDIEKLKGLFGESVVTFALQNRNSAPPSTHNAARMPDAQALNKQAFETGWLAILHWARQTQGEAAGWFEMRLPPALCAQTLPSAVTAFSRQPVEKALEYLFPQKQAGGLNE
jgi:hypothetical protein